METEVLNHPTIDQLKALKLDGMAEAFVELQGQESANDLGHAEWLALLLDREAANRNPFIPLHLGRKIWVFVDIGAAATFALHFWSLK
jgi:hypothetical protein